MKQKMKIIIAREGLIIISLLVLSGISLLINSYLESQTLDYKVNAKEIKPDIFDWIAAEPNFDYNGAKKAGYSDSEIAEYLGKQITLQFPKGTSQDVINKTLNKELPRIKENDFNAYDKNGNRVFNGLFYKINFTYLSFFFLKSLSKSTRDA